MPSSERPNGECTSRQADQEPHEQHDQHIDIGSCAEQIEFEYPEDRADLHTLQTVVTARDLLRLVGKLEKHRDDGEAQHQERDAGRVEDQRTGNEAKDRRCANGDGMTDQRVAREVNGANAGDIRPETEISCVAERDNAGIAQHKVERHREQDPDHDLGAEAQVPAGDEEEGHRNCPWQRVTGERNRQAVVPAGC